MATVKGKLDCFWGAEKCVPGSNMACSGCKADKPCYNKNRYFQALLVPERRKKNNGTLQA